MDLSPELLTKAKAAKTAEDLLALAAENGITLTAEEAEMYFSQLHKRAESLAEATLADEELENVAGGSSCKDGRHYSDDWPYYLITTAFNSCSHFKLRENYILNVKWCKECEHSMYKKGIFYCWSRKRDNDPYK